MSSQLSTQSTRASILKIVAPPDCIYIPIFTENRVHCTSLLDFAVMFSTYYIYIGIMYELMRGKPPSYKYLSTKHVNSHLFAFSVRETREIEKRAHEVLLMRRQGAQTGDSQFLVPNISGVFGKYYAVNRSSVSSCLARTSKYPVGDDRDEQCMIKIIENHSLSAETIPLLTGYDRIIPCGEPLLDILKVHAQSTNSWHLPSVDTLSNYQNNRGMSMEILENCEWKELIIGKASDDDIRQFEKWISTNFKNDQKSFPSAGLACVVEKTKVAFYDIFRMGKPEYYGLELKLSPTLGVIKESEDPDMFTDADGKQLEDAWITFPSKVVLGNGLNWSAVISFDVKESNGVFTFGVHKISPKVIKLFESLPGVVGLHAEDDMDMLVDIILIITGQLLDITPAVGISPLSALAGWKLDNRDLETMSMIILGSAVSEVAAYGDGLWILPFHRIPDALKVYTLVNLKFNHIAYIVLLALLFRELFPDPDICCVLSDCNQETYIRWFNVWIASVVVNTVPYVVDERKAVSREELIRSLRERRKKAGKKATVSSVSPSRVEIIIKMLGAPTVSQGGPRFLQTVRERYLYQYEALKDGIKYDPYLMFAKELTAQQRMYARFGHTDILEASLQSPSINQGNSSLDLVSLPGLQKPIFRFNPVGITIKELVGLAKECNRDQREAVFEWARLNIGLISKFFQTCIDNDHFSKCYRGYYEDLRLMYTNVTSKDCKRVPGCEVSIKKRLHNTLIQEKAKLDKLEVDVVTQRKVVQQLEEDIERGDGIKRTRYIKALASTVSADPRNAERGRSRSAASPPPRGDLRQRIGRSPSIDLRDTTVPENRHSRSNDQSSRISPRSSRSRSRDLRSRISSGYGYSRSNGQGYHSVSSHPRTSRSRDYRDRDLRSRIRSDHSPSRSNGQRRLEVHTGAARRGRVPELRELDHADPVVGNFPECRQGEKRKRDTYSRIHIDYDA